MLSVTNKPLMLSAVMLNAVMLSVVAPMMRPGFYHCATTAAQTANKIQNFQKCLNKEISNKKCFDYSYPILTTVLQSGGGERVSPGNTKGGSITVPLTSCLTGLESAV